MVGSLKEQGDDGAFSVPLPSLCLDVLRSTLLPWCEAIGGNLVMFVRWQPEDGLPGGGDQRGGLFRPEDRLHDTESLIPFDSL